MKVCTKCGVTKPLDEFYTNSRPPPTTVSRCKTCLIAIERGRYKANPELKRAKARQYRKSSPERVRNTNLRRYGISLADYDALLGSQKGACAICRTIISHRRNNVFCVDHDHKTGAIRGLLCSWCNSILGHAKDTPETLIYAADYLLANQNKKVAKSGRNRLS